MCWYAELGSTYSKSNRIQDNGDGTIALVEVTAGSTCQFLAFGRKEKVTPIYYIKKCIQGQVYRPAENDCKGTGTADNYYGAQKFQACPTNSPITCSDSESQTMSSCANDTTGGRTWRPGNFLNGTGIENVSSYLKTRTEELPTGKTDFYWKDSPHLYLTDIDGLSPSSGSSLISFGYVLCFNNKS
jgi:hypothetical protein